ncbi:MAG: hypothetical protein WC121_04345 [Candidatus Kapaibacterium sp.]
MKKIFLLITLALLAFSSASALDPIKVAIVNNGGAAVNVQVNLTNYTGGTATNVYTSTTQSLTPNGSGIIMVDISDATHASGTLWSAIAPSDVNSYYVIDVNVGGNLYAQYRLDQQIISQSQGGVFDNDGNLSPSSSGAQNLGNDDNRWGELFVEGNTIHVGAGGGMAGNEEMALSYNDGTNTGTVKIDNVSVIDATKDLVTFNKLVSQNIGNDNTAFGLNAFLNKTGSFNTAYGKSVLEANTSGTNNTAIGSYSLLVNTEGSYNTTNGVNALRGNIDGDNNTAAGYSALELNSDGPSNTAIGFRSLGSNTQGGSNTAVGSSAGFDIETGNNNIFIGKDAGQNVSQKVDAQNSIAIGYNTYTTADNQVVIGDANITETQLRGVTLMDLAGGGNQNLIVDNTGKIVVGGGGTVSTNSTINGDGSGGSPLGINLANANTWTGNQTFGNVTTTGTLDQQGAVSNSTGDVVINDDANVTGSLDVDTDLNVDGNSTHVGTLDQQGAVSNSTGNVNISDNLVVTGYSDLQGSIGSTAGNLQIGDYVYINGDGTTNLTLTDGSIQRNSGSNETITLQNTGAGNLTLAVTGDVTASGDVTLSNLAGGGTQNIQVDNTGKIVVGGGGGGGTVSTNSTINGDGSGGSPLGINLANSNTWTANQTFSSSFLVTANARIAMTNSDNNARDIRFQEPSSSGTQYIGLRAPSVTSNSNYVFPASIGTPGQVLALNTVSSGSDSATTHWVTPSGGGNLAYTEVTANTTLNTDSQVLFITGNYTVTLPASPATGQLIQIYSESTTATLNPQSKVFRDGGADYGTSDFSDFTAGTNLTLFYNGTKWLPIGRR